jgi:hypothetical protein
MYDHLQCNNFATVDLSFMLWCSGTYKPYNIYVSALHEHI